jgi:hypothetical protein
MIILGFNRSIPVMAGIQESKRKIGGKPHHPDGETGGEGNTYTGRR